jgi:hypothetical protein
MDDDALSVGKIWSVNYFFYNKQLKKLAFFACWIKSKIRSRDVDGGEDMDRLCAAVGVKCRRNVDVLINTCRPIC